MKASGLILKVLAPSCVSGVGLEVIGLADIDNILSMTTSLIQTADVPSLSIGVIQEHSTVHLSRDKSATHCRSLSHYEFSQKLKKKKTKRHT
jgi:hypothetical protein